MKILSISYSNFRQFKDQTVDLSSKDGKNVTVIYGSNHVGKTTFVKSIIWCLYPDSEIFGKGDDLFNKDVLNSLPISALGKQYEAKVTIELEHGAYHYLVSTSQKYNFVSRGSGGPSLEKTSPKPTQIIFRNLKSDPSGKADILDNFRAASEIESILPQDLKDYFFYDGEANRIDEVADKRELGKSVSRIMNFDARDQLINLLKKNGPIWKDFEKQKDSTSFENQAQLEAKREQLVSKKQDFEKQLADTIKDRDLLEAQRDEKKAQIEAHKEAGQWQTQRRESERDLERLQDSIETEMQYMLNDLSGDLGTVGFLALWGASKAVRTTGIIDKLEEIKKDGQVHYEHLTAATIEEILNNGVCICGTPIPGRGDIYNKLKELEKHVSPNDNSGLLSGLKNELLAFEPVAKNSASNVSRHLRTIWKCQKDIDSCRDTIKECDQKLRNFTGDVSVWNDDVMRLSTLIGARNESIKRLSEHDISDIDKQLDSINKNISSFEASNEKNKYLNACLECLDDVREFAESRRESARKSVVENLQKRVNEVYQYLSGDKTVTFKIGEANFNVTPYYAMGARDKKVLSQAESGMKNLAFVSSLVYMARHRNDVLRDADDDESEEFPLVLDAPFSNFDKDNVTRACQVLPQNCSQLIITLLDKDQDISVEYIKPFVSQRYHLETNENSTDSTFEED